MSKTGSKSTTTKGQQFIAFSVDGQLCAVDTRELIGVAADCPQVSYPGLPEGVVGIVQWNGKIFPVVDWFGLGEVALRGAAHNFLFNDQMAVVVPGPVKVFFAAGEKQIGTEMAHRGADGIVVDAQGELALRVTFKPRSSEVANAA